jgi:hypothetical protein
MCIRLQTLGFHPKPCKLFEKSLIQNFIPRRFAAGENYFFATPFALSKSRVRYPGQDYDPDSGFGRYMFG